MWRVFKDNQSNILTIKLMHQLTPKLRNLDPYTETLSRIYNIIFSKLHNFNNLINSIILIILVYLYFFPILWVYLVCVSLSLCLSLRMFANVMLRFLCASLLVSFHVLMMQYQSTVLAKDLNIWYFFVQ